MPVGSRLKTYRESHTRNGRPVRGHQMRYHSTLDFNGKRKFQPGQDYASKRNLGDPLQGEHLAELKQRVRRLNAAGPGDAPRARSDALIYLNFINGLGNLKPAEFAAYRQHINTLTKKELEDQSRTRLHGRRPFVPLQYRKR